MQHCVHSPPGRRTFLVRSLAAAGLFGTVPLAPLAVTGLVVGNVTGLYPVEVARVATPRSAAEVALLLKSWAGRVAVGGGRYSMGGQVAVHAGLHLDMRRMNRLVWLRPDERVARVQAGMRWRDLQDQGVTPAGLVDFHTRHKLLLLSHSPELYP